MINRTIRRQLGFPGIRVAVFGSVFLVLVPGAGARITEIDITTPAKTPRLRRCEIGRRAISDDQWSR